MTTKNSKNIKTHLVGPGNDCNCPVCLFTKTQAPGNPYDLKYCPKCKSYDNIKKKDKDDFSQ